MKPAFTFLLCLCLSNMLLAQGSYQAKFAYNASFFPAYSLLPAADGGTITFGNVYACDSLYNCIYAIYARHFDNKGELVWSKNYSTQFSVSRPQTLATKDGGFIFIGYLYDTPTKSWKGGLVVKCNSAGNVVWSREILSNTYSTADPGMIGEDESGNILLFYTVGNDMFYSRVLRIAKLNSRGNIVWSRTGQLALGYPTDSYASYSFKQIGNRYYIMGATICDFCEGQQGGNLLVMDTAGNVQKSRGVSADSAFGISTAVTDIFSRGGMLYMLGNFDDGYSYKRFLIPLTDTSTVSSGILFSSDLFSLQYQLRAFKNIYPLSVNNLTYFNKDGVLTQQAYTSKISQPSFTIQQYDSLNRLCPDYNQPLTDTTSSPINMIIGRNRFDILDDSAYLKPIDITVRSGTFNYQLICNGGAAKDKLNNSLPAITSGLNRKITIYPNPARDVVYIGGLQQSGAISMYSSLGNVVKTVSVTLPNPFISIADLKSGVYFLKIMERGKPVQVVSFVKAK